VLESAERGVAMKVDRRLLLAVLGTSTVAASGSAVCRVPSRRGAGAVDMPAPHFRPEATRRYAMRRGAARRRVPLARARPALD